MNRIDILDLDKTAQGIYDLYRHERGDLISLNVVREMLDTWAVEKYPIFEKFGKKLMLETEEDISMTVGLQDSFINSCAEYSDKHYEKSAISEGEDKATRLRKEKHSIIGQILTSLTELEEEDIEHILENKAYPTELALHDFLREVMRYYPVKPSAKNLERALKQTKLTKQVAAYMKGTGGLCDIPAWYDEEDAKMRIEDHKKYVENYSDCFNIALSEVKQSVVVDPQKKKFVMSIHPYDYVTMSYNEIGWRSCFHPDGEYAASTFSVLMDNSTVVTYIPSEKFIPNGLAAHINDKRYRAMVHFSTDFETLLVNKIYPSNLKSFRNIVVSAANKLNLFEKPISMPEGVAFSSYVSDSMYNDLDRTTGAVLAMEGFERTGPSTDYVIGVDVPCLSCGHLNCDYDDDGDLNCLVCRYGKNYSYCQSCGRHVPESEMGDGEDSVHCIECMESGNTEYCNCEVCYERSLREEEEEEEEEETIVTVPTDTPVEFFQENLFSELPF